MVPKEISSLQHPIVKRLVKLREDKGARHQEGLALISGKKLVEEIAAEQPLEMLFLPQGMEVPPGWQVNQVYWVAEGLFKKITGLMHPELIAAAVKLPKEHLLEDKQWIVALDGVSDPGNLGTLLRTALALGWEGAFLISGCSDPFNEKAVRAAKGASFRLPLRYGSAEQLLQLAQKNSLATWVADLAGTAVDRIERSKNGLLILGSEAHGVSSILKEHGTRVTIPLTGKMESLNVAGAGAILMYILGSK